MKNSVMHFVQLFLWLIIIVAQKAVADEYVETTTNTNTTSNQHPEGAQKNSSLHSSFYSPRLRRSAIATSDDDETDRVPQEDRRSIECGKKNGNNVFEPCPKDGNGGGGNTQSYNVEPKVNLPWCARGRPMMCDGEGKKMFICHYEDDGSYVTKCLPQRRARHYLHLFERDSCGMCEGTLEAVVQQSNGNAKQSSDNNNDNAMNLNSVCSAGRRMECDSAGTHFFICRERQVPTPTYISKCLPENRAKDFMDSYGGAYCGVCKEVMDDILRSGNN